MGQLPPYLFKPAQICHLTRMTTIALDKAQEQLAGLVKRALEGEEIVIEGPDASAVKLAPVAKAAAKSLSPGRSHRGRGALRNQLVVGPEFFEPLSEEECGVADGPGPA